MIGPGPEGVRLTHLPTGIRVVVLRQGYGLRRRWRRTRELAWRFLRARLAGADEQGPMAVVRDYDGDTGAAFGGEASPLDPEMREFFRGTLNLGAV